MKIEMTKEINPAKLHDELLMAGLIEPTQEDGTSPIRGNVLYLPDDGNIEAIQSVIDAHNPSPDPNIAIKQALTESDAGIARIAEDIYNFAVLGISISDQDKQRIEEKIAERQALRGKLTSQ